MTNSYPAGSPGALDSSMPTGAPGNVPRRSSYASVVSGQASAMSQPYQPTRSGAFSHFLANNDFSYDPNYQSLGEYARYNSRSYDMNFGINEGFRGIPDSWGRNTQLPSFSSAFGLLTNGNGFGGFGGGYMNNFFMPSYLKGSKYVQKLEEVHKAKTLAHKDGLSAPSSQPGSLSTSSSSINLHAKMAPSHRGMTFDVIEKAPPAEDESIAPLPSRWNIQDKNQGLEVLSDGQEVKFTGSKSDRDREHEAYAIRADHHMPPQCGIYYFEVTIISRKREESSIGIGFSSKSVILTRLPGWEPESYAYHGDDGHSYCSSSTGKNYGPPFGVGDVIGCGVNFRTGSAFFTKNGDHLGTAFREIFRGKIYPSVGMKKSGEHIRVNFGQSPFVFDIDGMMSASSSYSFDPNPPCPEARNGSDEPPSPPVVNGSATTNGPTTNQPDRDLPLTRLNGLATRIPALSNGLTANVPSLSFSILSSSLNPSNIAVNFDGPPTVVGSLRRQSRSLSERLNEDARSIIRRLLARSIREEQQQLSSRSTERFHGELRSLFRGQAAISWGDSFTAIGTLPRQNLRPSQIFEEAEAELQQQRQLVQGALALQRQNLPPSQILEDAEAEQRLPEGLAVEDFEDFVFALRNTVNETEASNQQPLHWRNLPSDHSELSRASIQAYDDRSTDANISKQQEKLQIKEQIEKCSTANLAPPLNETELIQSLVLQFLTHDGYVETARAFAREVHSEKEALNLEPNAFVNGFDVQEDEDAGHRQRIRTAVLEGDIEKALKITNTFYPNVLKDNEHVYFRLRCRRFIEMIRQGAEMQNLTSSNGTKTSNGHKGDWYDDIINHDMDLDDHQQSNNWDRMDTEEAAETQLEYQQLLQDTISYGQALQAEFKDDPRREVSQALQDAFALIAYQDPLNTKAVAHLLDPSGRTIVAEELNSVILLSLGKSSSAALEKLCQQTTVLLEDLAADGGPGALVNINDFIRLEDRSL